jgi:pilus assembly protein CpaF
MLHQSGRRIDVSQPFVDASLPDGSRLHVVLAGIARGAWSVNIRKFLPGFGSLDTLVDRGSLPRAEADRLTRAVRDGSSILVSGATHAGKTTLLSALVSESLPSQRIVTVEETFELSIDATDIASSRRRCACARIASSSARCATPRRSTSCSPSTRACPAPRRSMRTRPRTRS